MFVFSKFFYGLFPLDFWILKGGEFHFEETKSKISSEKTKLSFFEKWDVALLAPLIYPTPGLLSKSWQSYRICLENLPFSQKNKKKEGESASFLPFSLFSMDSCVLLKLECNFYNTFILYGLFSGEF